MWIKRRFIAQASTRMMDGWRNDVKCLKWDSSMQKIPNAPTEYDKIANDRQPVNGFSNDNWILCKASRRHDDDDCQWLSWTFVGDSARDVCSRSWHDKFVRILLRRVQWWLSGIFLVSILQLPTSASNIFFYFIFIAHLWVLLIYGFLNLFRAAIRKCSSCSFVLGNSRPTIQLSRRLMLKLEDRLTQLLMHFKSRQRKCFSRSIDSVLRLNCKPRMAEIVIEKPQPRCATFSKQQSAKERKSKTFQIAVEISKIDLWRGNSRFGMEIYSNRTHHLILARKAFDTQMEIRRLLVFLTCALHLPNQPARDAFECWARLKLRSYWLDST